MPTLAFTLVTKENKEVFLICLAVFLRFSHCVTGEGSLVAVDTQCLYNCPGLSSPAPLGTWLGVLPIYCSGISVVMVLWGGCWGPGAVGHRSHQHKIVYVCPQLCKIYTKGIKTKLTAEINVLTLGFYEAFG